VERKDLDIIQWLYRLRSSERNFKRTKDLFKCGLDLDREDIIIWWLEQGYYSGKCLKQIILDNDDRKFVKAVLKILIRCESDVINDDLEKIIYDSHLDDLKQWINKYL
jgi:hypothetical protein